jgi:hypothetical protein
MVITSMISLLAQVENLLLIISLERAASAWYCLHFLHQHLRAVLGKLSLHAPLQKFRGTRVGRKRRAGKNIHCATGTKSNKTSRRGRKLFLPEYGEQWRIMKQFVLAGGRTGGPAVDAALIQPREKSRRPARDLISIKTTGQKNRVFGGIWEQYLFLCFVCFPARAPFGGEAYRLFFCIPQGDGT